MKNQVLDAGFLMKNAFEGLQAMGLTHEQLQMHSVVDIDRLMDASERKPHECYVALWNILERQTADPDIGLHIAEHSPIYKGMIIEYLFLSCPTFGEGMEHLLQYKRLLTEGFEMDVDEDQDGFFFTFDSIDPETDIDRHTNESTALNLIKFFGYVSDGAFKPLRIDFRHGEPGNLAEHSRLYGCEVGFNCSANRIYFDPALMERPSPRAEPRLLQLHEQAADEYLARLQRQDEVHAVRDVIAETLESGLADLETVAERLKVRPRELQSRLAAANTNFNEVLNNYRRQLARELLATTDEPIEEIVYLTGFSEPSNFYRAFKRWEGITPSLFRQRSKERGLDKRLVALA